MGLCSNCFVLQLYRLYLEISLNILIHLLFYNNRKKLQVLPALTLEIPDHSSRNSRLVQVLASGREGPFIALYAETYSLSYF